MKYLLAVSITLSLLYSCNPVKMVARQHEQYQSMVDEYNKNHPQRLDTASSFSKGVAKSDTTKTIITTVIKSDTIIRNDTVVIEKYFNNTATNTINNVTHDTLYRTIVDKEQFNICERKNSKLESDLGEANKKLDSKKFLLLYLIISGLINIILLIIILKK